MRLLSVVSVVSIAMASPGCTAIGAGTGALAAVTANHFIDPHSPHRIPVGATAAAGAVMGLIIDILVINALNNLSFDLGESSCPSCN